uniref:Uncharacterized protein n=1 Tax=Peronospora matthiolae TaxID=2874970 RepID=A0AAV1TC15_9STRA
MSAGFELMHLGMSSALESDVSNHNEEGEEHGSPAVAQSRTESERSVARYPSKRSRMNDPETLLDRDIKVKDSKQVKVNKRQAAANKKNQEMVGTEGQEYLPFEKATVYGRRVEQIGRKLHGAPESVAPYHNSNRVKQPIANPSDNDAFVSSILSKFQEGAEIVDKNRSPSLGGSPHSNRGNNLSQELRGRSCVMHAGHKDVDAAKNVKCSNKTVISMPRRFQEYSVPRMFNCGTSSSAPPGPGCSYSDAALAASTPVFSSSNSFSMKSWFKRLDGRFH